MSTGITRILGGRAWLKSGVGAGALSVALSVQSLAEVPVIAAAQVAPTPIVGASDAKNERKPDGYIYRIGPEDRLKVTVRNEPDISGEFPVRPDGRFSMPLLGDVDADLRHPEDLAVELANALSRYVRDPFVTVEVISPRGTIKDRIRFIGKGISPRSIAYRDGMTALDALAEIGGLPPTAAANRVELLRESERSRVRMRDIAERAENNIALQPGDILIVPESFLAGTRIFEPSVTIAETWTDNINFRQGDLKEDSYITEIIPEFLLDYDTARLKATLDASIRLQYRTNVEDDFRINPDIRLNSTTEITEDLLFADFDASVSRTVVDNRRAGSNNPANSNNTQLLQTWTASPYLKSSLGSYANLEARLSSSATFIGSPTEDSDPLPGIFANTLRNDTFTQTASFTLSDARPQSRLSWRLFGQWRWLEVDNQVDSRRREIFLSPEYAVTDDFFLIAEIGY